MATAVAFATAPLLIIAPRTLQREGLLRTLTEHLPQLPVEATADVATGLFQLPRRPPALLILDAHLSGPPLDDVLTQVRAVRPGQRVLVLGGKRLPFHVGRLLVEMGGGMLLTRRATPEDVVAAVVRLVGADASPILMRTVRKAAEPQAPYGSSYLPTIGLSRRELEILRLVTDDFGSAEIAERLCLSVRTVETHRRNLLLKTGTRSMVGLVLLAVRQGWIEMG